MKIETLANIGDSAYFIRNGRIEYEKITSIMIKINNAHKEEIIYQLESTYNKLEAEIALTQEDLFEKIRL